MKDHRLTIVRMMLALTLLILWLSLLPGCGDSCCDVRPRVCVAAFQAIARSGGCAQHRNDLFMIDGSLVYWDREGDCPDAGYSRILFGSVPDEKLCWEADSFLGYQRVYADRHYRRMFDIILANRDRADLGLGRGHVVEPIGF